MTDRRNLILSIVIALLLVVIVGMLVFGSSKTFAQENPVDSQPREISVLGQGMASVQPDIAQVTIGVQTSASSVSQATQENADKMNQVITDIKALGVSDSDIQTSLYNIYPQYQNKNGGTQGITGYQVNNSVQITIRDLSNIGQILDKAVQAGANTISNISFNYSNPAKLQAEALNQAYTDARGRAEILSKAGGVQLGDVISISETTSSGPVPLAESSTTLGGGGTPIQSGTVEIKAQVQVVYSIH
jgi:uncharacterized protein YggE